LAERFSREIPLQMTATGSRMRVAQEHGQKKQKRSGSRRSRPLLPFCGIVEDAATKAVVVSASNDEIYGLGTLAFLVGLHVEADALPLNKRFQPRTFNGGNVNKHVAAAIVWLDEAVTAFPVEEFDRTGHCH
jgi:hypothetical protein